MSLGHGPSPGGSQGRFLICGLLWRRRFISIFWPQLQRELKGGRNWLFGEQILNFRFKLMRGAYWAWINQFIRADKGGRLSTQKLSLPELAGPVGENGFNANVKVPYPFRARDSLSLLLIFLGQSQVSAKIGEICIKCSWQVTGQGLYSCCSLMRVSLVTNYTAGDLVLVLYNRRDPSNRRNYPAWKILSISITKYFIGLLPDWSHYPVRTIWGFHSRPLIVSGWLYQSNVKKFVRGSPFYEHVMNSLRPIIRDHPMSPLRIFVTERPRDTDRDIIVTGHVRFAWRHLWILVSTIVFAVCNNSNRMFVQKCLQLKRISSLRNTQNSENKGQKYLFGEWMIVVM